MADLVRGGVDRKQVRRDAEAIINGEGGPADDWGYDDDLMRRAASGALALLAELEQAEKERDEVREDWAREVELRIEDEPAAVRRAVMEGERRIDALDRELTLALNDLETLRTVVADLEARLAKVPALVEALKGIAATTGWEGPDGTHDSWSHWATQARAALAEWEQG